ncbi:TonB-dependent receptor [Acidipila sp. EB88]|uniref:TonB-dependent receptor n=1 Tax=Acidipila sp. EB88 TaxID=2305226 RepID=UPI000F5F1BAB|nr:TonB-dependent receptor [Acidipila sp. EB88]RRA48697.1 TonB-dependent receptor [Acidipila sp. EB88]
MLFSRRFVSPRFHSTAIAFAFALAAQTTTMLAQSASHTGSLNGTVSDTTGAIVPGASITVTNPVSGFTRTTTADASGAFSFNNLPYNNYHVVITAQGFGAVTRDASITSGIPASLTAQLQVGVAAQSITVESSDLVDTGTGMQTNVDRNTLAKLPLESATSGLSSLVTLTTPGVSADSNGLLHGLGDHASNTFAIDGQSISDQQSKAFSNQLPSNVVQSVQVIDGAPPAEYGDKTSLVIQVTTRSGLGLTRPTGSITTSYGSFGTATAGIDLGYGTSTFGNFFETDGLNTGRFLDAPEFSVMHDRGNEQNIFDRIDRQFTAADSIHLDLTYSRSWFQTPDTFDNLNAGKLDPLTGAALAPTDQHSKIETFNIAPTYTRVLGSDAVFNFAPFVRKDAYNYYPSHDAFADLGPVNLQRESIAQQRTLLNTGVHSDISVARGVNTIKAGAVYEQTFLREHDALGVVDPTLNAPCLDAAGDPVSGFTDPAQCAAAGLLPNTVANPNSVTPFNPVLAPYDLTRGGTNYLFNGHTDVKELALYIEDQIKAGNWNLNLGIRGDLYNGLAVARQAEPRLGVSYNVKRTNTVLRVSYARTLETPFNENLVLSSVGCGDAVLNPLLACAPGVTNTVEQPGFRNEFHAGLTQALGRHFVFTGDYIWKYTHNAFDFSVLGNTPITFPIDWHNSKIPGYAIRADLLDLHNLTAYVSLSSVAARFFNPQQAGAGATPGTAGSNLPFRIDHDEKFNQTTHLQYQIPGKFSPWFGFNWRYDSGEVAGAAPCFNDIPGANTGCGATSVVGPGGQQYVVLSGLTADQQFEAGLSCNGVRATPSQALPSQCLATQLASSLISIPAPNTEDDDKNPPRIAARNLFDLSIGEDDLFHGDRYKWSAQLTGINIANNYALYNFLSTFSGTHYVTPRALTAQVGLHF